MSDEQNLRQQPPPIPWQKGKAENYSAFSLTVDVCQDSYGRVWSGHSYETIEDEKTALSLPHGGAQQVAYALLTEAARREVFVTLLVQMTKTPEFVGTWKDSPEDEQRVMEAELGEAAATVMAQTLQKMGPGVAREILTMISDQE